MDLIKLSQYLSSKGLLNSDLKPFISNPAANPSDSLEDRDKLSMSQVKDLGTSLFSGLNMGINAGSKFAGANPLLNGAGDFVNKTIGGLSPTAGLTNAASDLGLNLVGKAIGKDSNYTDSLSKGVDIASNTLSMFGPWGQGAALALKGINLIGSTKVGGTKVGENMSSTSGYSINNLKVDDANIGGIGNIFGLDNKYKKDVKAKQKKLDLGEKILGSNKEILESSGETAQRLSLRNQNKKLGTSNSIRFAKEGGKIFSDSQLEEARNVLKFKKGGNLIPEGALHARKHELEIEGITNKGIPIIAEEGGKIEQHMEIERNEIIFSLEVTKKLEELAKLGTDDAAIEAGKLLTYEIMENTEDRTNLIQTI